ncbi:MAG: tRNA pseudouridine(55) synthase TruB, partial [Planctomycetaceae bacterium]
MIGFLNVNKPAGPSSHDMVHQVRRLVGRGVKVGHAGTLDPFAQGVLVACIGPACRLAEYIQAQPKKYQAQIILGATSDTDDPTGVIAPMTGATAPLQADIESALRTQVGTIQQIPPAHSAVHIEGRRAYDMARQGLEVNITARPVEIHEIRLLAYNYPTLDIEVACGSGTYIRSIARDVGAALGVGGYCAKLIRTQIGPFSIEQAKKPADMRIPDDLISPAAGLPDFPSIMLNERDILTIRYGKKVLLANPAV